MYRITCRENGDIIETVKTLDEAREIVRGYEAEDREEGTYTEDFYAIEEVVIEVECESLSGGGTTVKWFEPGEEERAIGFAEDYKHDVKRDRVNVNLMRYNEDKDILDCEQLWTSYED